MKTLLKLYLGLALLIASQACTPLVPPATLDPNGIGTAIAGTRAAALAQTAQVEGPSATPVTPTVTRAPTWTPFATYTVPVVASRITVSVNTNCRKGPGKMYDRVGSLLAGQSVQPLGRSQDGKYWVIRNPDRAGVCWISDEFVVMTGMAGLLPIFTAPPRPTKTPAPAPTKTSPPPPTATSSTVVVGPITPIITPTAGFTFTYSGKVNCGAEWWIELQLQNTGGIPYQSMSMTLLDTTAGTGISLTTDGFINRNHCPWDLDTRAILLPGTSRVISSPILTYDPTGHAFNVEITVCSEVGLAGTCAVQSMDFTPP